MNSVLFSSNSDEWATPQEVFDSLNDEFCFTLDAAATEDNHKCDRYYTMAQDGLNQDWGGEHVFVNPPYSQISRWVEKAYKEGYEKGKSDAMNRMARMMGFKNVE